MKNRFSLVVIVGLFISSITSDASAFMSPAVIYLSKLKQYCDALKDQLQVAEDNVIYCARTKAPDDKDPWLYVKLPDNLCKKEYDIYINLYYKWLQSCASSH